MKQYRNSFHWNPEQYAQLSSAFLASENPNDLSAADYGFGHMRHWLRKAGGTRTLGHSLDMERWPSPDGSTVGQTVWYDYEGKDLVAYPREEGTRPLPLCVAVVVAPGPPRCSHYVRYERNQWGKPTEIVQAAVKIGRASCRERV